MIYLRGGAAIKARPLNVMLDGNLIMSIWEYKATDGARPCASSLNGLVKNLRLYSLSLNMLLRMLALRSCGLLFRIIYGVPPSPSAFGE